jgi:hypothetical protein
MSFEVSFDPGDGNTHLIKTFCKITEDGVYLHVNIY